MAHLPSLLANLTTLQVNRSVPLKVGLTCLYQVCLLCGPHAQSAAPGPSNLLPYNLLPCNLLPCGLQPCNLLPCDSLPCNLLPCNLLPCNLIPCNLIPCNLIPCNLIPYNLLPCNLLPCNLLPCNLHPQGAAPGPQRADGDRRRRRPAPRAHRSLSPVQQDFTPYA